MLSPHFIHHTSNSGAAKAGDAIPLSSISTAFATARKRSGIVWEDGKTHPTFHEIRSLAARLYSAQGTDAQALLGHKSAQTTAMYKDARGAEWVEVQAG